MTKEEKAELDYLRYFYGAVDGALGPASGDIYQMIAENYDGEVPEGYLEEDEDDEGS